MQEGSKRRSNSQAGRRSCVGECTPAPVIPAEARVGEAPNQRRPLENECVAAWPVLRLSPAASSVAGTSPSSVGGQRDASYVNGRPMYSVLRRTQRVIRPALQLSQLPGRGARHISIPILPRPSTQRSACSFDDGASSDRRSPPFCIRDPLVISGFWASSRRFYGRGAQCGNPDGAFGVNGRPGI